MSTPVEDLFDELFRVLGYDNLPIKQLKIKLFEGSLRIKALKDELEETKISKASTVKGLEDLKIEMDSVKQELEGARDRGEMLEGIIDRNRQIIEYKGYTPSLLVKKYNSISNIESQGPYCGGTAYIESDILSLESRLERAKLDLEEIDIENRELLEKVRSLEAEIEFIETHPSEYQIDQDFRIRQLILSGEGLEKDYDDLVSTSKKQEEHIEKQNNFLSELNKEVADLKTFIGTQKIVIVEKEENIGARDIEIENLNRILSDQSTLLDDLKSRLSIRETEISSLEETISENVEVLALKDDIIDYYSQFF